MRPARLLDPSATRVDLGSLGFQDDHGDLFRSALSLPQGMVLVTGPTGSGKSTTLYAALNMVVSPTLNIVTVEDPVEFKIRGINQVQIHPKAGLNFASCLRAAVIRSSIGARAARHSGIDISLRP